jgi:hypothetical protein
VQSDRAEQGAADRTPAAAADDQQIGAGGGIDENLGRRALHGEHLRVHGTRPGHAADRRLGPDLGQELSDAARHLDQRGVVPGHDDGRYPGPRQSHRAAGDDVEPGAAPRSRPIPMAAAGSGSGPEVPVALRPETLGPARALS